jgi:hypothetical protein
VKPSRRQGQLPFKMPFAKAVDNLRRKVLGRDDYDPAVLFVWGQMNAVAVIEMLKEVVVERRDSAPASMPWSASGSAWQGRAWKASRYRPA